MTAPLPSEECPALGHGRCQLFCLPYAGGGASLYKDWTTELAPTIDVVALQLPGRENRWREPLYRRLEPLVERWRPRRRGVEERNDTYH